LKIPTTLIRRNNLALRAISGNPHRRHAASEAVPAMLHLTAFDGVLQRFFPAGADAWSWSLSERALRLSERPEPHPPSFEFKSVLPGKHCGSFPVREFSLPHCP
jgi:hypothetical protein